MNGFLVAAVIVAAVAAWTDWRNGEIPNWLTLPALGIAPLAHIAFASSPSGGGQPMDLAMQEGGFSLLGAALCAIVPTILYRQNAIGGGDLKLLAALGAIFQPTIGVEAQMYGFFAAALVAPARLAYEGKLLRMLKNASLVGMNMFLPKSRQKEVTAETMTWFRMGPAIFAGVIVAAYLHWTR